MYEVPMLLLALMVVVALAYTTDLASSIVEAVAASFNASGFNVTATYMRQVSTAPLPLLRLLVIAVIGAIAALLVTAIAGRERQGGEQVVYVQQGR